MRGAAFWKADWFPGLALSCAMFALVGRQGSTGAAYALGAALLVAGYLIVLLPRLSVLAGALTTVLFFIALSVGYFGLRHSALLVPLACLPVGHLLLVGKRLLMQGGSAESNRRQVQIPTAHRSTADPLPAADTSDQAAEAMPARIGRYRIDKRLGRGAMGEVFLGCDSEHGTLAAIKTLALTQAFAPDELADARARFFREAETAGRLRHPDIVAILDAGDENELAFIAMEFLSGTDLRLYTRPDHLLPLPTVARLGARIADALAYAHANNVVHRDVKPGNVMYDPVRDQLRVMDFGVARITDSSRTKTGMVLGTPSYMSPEQLLGRKVDGRSDLYSLGVLLYQLTCGQLPFVGQSLGQLMSRIANEACPDIRTVNPLVPEALAAVIERAMRKAAAERFQTGGDMAQALRACFAGNVDTVVERPAEAAGER